MLRGVDRERGLGGDQAVGRGLRRPAAESIMVVTDLDGKVVDGTLKPSSDLETHTLLLSRVRGDWRGGAYALGVCDQLCAGGDGDSGAGDDPCGLFLRPVPCTAPLTDEAIGGRYVHETGLAIVRRFAATVAGAPATCTAAIDPLAVPACLVAGHAPILLGQGCARGGAQRRGAGGRARRWRTTR